MLFASQFKLNSHTRLASLRAEHLLFCAFLLLLFWLPLPLGSNRPWAWPIMELGSFGVFIGVLWACRSSLNKRLRPYRLPIGLLCLFVFWIGVQYLPLPAALVQQLSPDSYRLFVSSGTGEASWMTLSVDPVQTEISFYKSLSYLCLFVTCLLIVTSPLRAQAVLVCFLIAGAWQALYGSAQLLSGGNHSLVFDLPKQSAATGSFVDPNHYANYLLLCLAMSVGLLVSTLETRKVQGSRARLKRALNALLNSKVLVRSSLAIMVVGLVMSRSAIGNAGFFIAMAVSGLLGLSLIKKRTQVFTYLMVSMAVIATFVLTAWFGLTTIHERISQNGVQPKSSNVVIRDVVPMVGDYAVSGAGLGSFYGLFPSYKSGSVQQDDVHAHNDYLQFMIEAGMPATLALMVLVAFCAYSALQALQVRSNSTMKGLAFGSVMAIIAMATQMTADSPLQIPANAAYFMITLAMALVSLHGKTGLRRRRINTARW